MLTITYEEAEARAAARRRIFKEAFSIMEAVQDILSRPKLHNLQAANTLQTMEDRMNVLLEEMQNLRGEEVRKKSYGWRVARCQ
jgi:hypothetical protein